VNDVFFILICVGGGRGGGKREKQTDIAFREKEGGKGGGRKGK